MEFLSGMVAGLASACVGGLVVFVVMSVRMDRPPHGGGSSDTVAPTPDPTLRIIITPTPGGTAGQTPYQHSPFIINNSDAGFRNTSDLTVADILNDTIPEPSKRGRLDGE